MSVPKSKRGESGFQVIDTSRELKRKMIQICVKLPKRYTDLILKDAVADSKAVARYTRIANSIFPTNQHEAQIRIDNWMLARATLEVLSDDLNDILEIPSVLRYNESGKSKGVTINELDEISDLIDLETKLVKGCLEKDRKRYKQLP